MLMTTAECVAGRFYISREVREVIVGDLRVLVSSVGDGWSVRQVGCECCACRGLVTVRPTVLSF